jgi:hypothetical protein
LVLTALQNAAVGITRHHRGHVARDQSDHRFVEQRHTFADVAEADEGAPPTVTGNRGKITIAKPARDPARLVECVMTGGRVTLNDALNRSGNQEVSAQDGLEPRLVEDVLGSDEPA